MKTLTILLKILVFVILFLIPFGGRWLWHYRGNYKAPTIASIDQAKISTYSETYNTYTDQPQPGRGRIVIDLTHQNNLLVDDLTPLNARLAVRGVEVVIFDNSSSENLATRLRGATALVELVPSISYEPEERQAIIDFVNDGGRLLLAADPTRPVLSIQPVDTSDLYSILFPESAIPAINSLASTFGVSYFEDYVYNLTDYDANYRNVKYTTFSKDADLTKGLSQVTLFAAHSIRGEGLPLITGDKNTFSNVRTGETGFAPAMISKNGKVLSLGDITFMTSPYYQVSDNDHFLSNIADWLATDSRQWDIKDFPYLFTGQVDLIQTFSDAVDPRLIAQSTPLQQIFTQSGIPIELRAEASPEHDTLYIGTYANLETEQKFLTAANITITFSSTQTTTAVTESSTYPEVENDTETPDETIVIKDFGTFLAHGSSLFLISRNGNHIALSVLAEDEEAVLGAVQRLLVADLDGCVSHQDVTVCSTGEAPTNEQPVETPVVEPTPEGDGGSGVVEPGSSKKIFILSVDNGLNGKRNSTPELLSALDSLYDVTVWSVQKQGIPSDSDLLGYDAVILDTGDYAYDEEMGKVIGGLTSPDNMLIVGEQPFQIDGTLFKAAPISDLVVADAEHPVAATFSKGETILLSEAESGNPAIVLPKDIFQSIEGSSVVFERGPGSEDAGAPAVFASDNGSGSRMVLASFSVYRLPVDKQVSFILNIINWLTNND